MKTDTQFKAELLKDEEFKKIYNDLRFEFQIIETHIKNRIKNN